MRNLLWQNTIPFVSSLVHIQDGVIYPTFITLLL